MVPGLFAYSRVLNNEEVFVCFNTAGSSQTLTNRTTTYSPGTMLVNLLDSNDTLVVIAGSTTNNTPPIPVPSMTAKIYIAQSLVLPLDPVIVSQSPVHAATGIAPSAPVVLQFSKPMNTNAVQAAFSVTPATTGVFMWDTLHDTMTFTPSAGWPMTTTNLIHLATNAVDSVSGNSFYAAFDTYFVTMTNTLLSCAISGPSSVCGNSSSLTYTVLPSLPILSVNWFISGNGTISGPANGASVVVNGGDPAHLL